MRHSRLVCILSAIIVTACSFSCHAASSYGKTLYRSLSERLGRNRADYPGLTDEEFANFRMVRTSGIAPGKLYRSSSPISTWGSRNVIADNAIRDAGVRTIINLADSDEGMREHEGYSGSYYSQQKVVALNLRMKYQSSDFRRRLARGIRFMAAGEPPYLVHCSLGKDRAGFVCAVIECLMGATLEEVAGDYMVSFYNYFGIIPGSAEYDFVVRNEIYSFLSANFGAANLLAVNLSDYAEKYLRGLGVSQDDIDTLREKLRH